MSVIILAGGKSERMGKLNKQFLSFGSHQTMLAYIIERVKLVMDDIIVTARNCADYSDLNCRLVKDIYNAGPLGGIHAGLLAAADEYCFVLACDMPFVNIELIKYMYNNIDGDVLIPRINGNKLEPLHAVYHRNCIEPIENDIKRGEQKIIHFFPEVEVDYLEESVVREFAPELLSFFNINTYSDYYRALRKLAKETTDR